MTSKLIWAGRVLLVFVMATSTPSLTRAQAAIDTETEAGRSEDFGERSTGRSKIIGGRVVAIAKHPWQVALFEPGQGDAPARHLCGGSLLGDRWVVTAAHCFDRIDNRTTVTVLSGNDDLSKGEAGATSAVLIHEDYDRRSRNNDIALILLRDAASGKPIVPASITDEMAIVGSYDLMTISGWGRTEFGVSSSLLRAVEVPLQSRTRCNGRASYNGRITENMFCAGFDIGDRAANSCQGDSGGPGVVQNRLLGIVSGGEGCERAFKYGVYTRVAQYVGWLEDCMKNPSVCPKKE